MIYRAIQLIQIFSAGGSTGPATGHGGTRGPRGPKKKSKYKKVSKFKTNWLKKIQKKQVFKYKKMGFNRTRQKSILIAMKSTTSLNNLSAASTHCLSVCEVPKSRYLIKYLIVFNHYLTQFYLFRGSQSRWESWIWSMSSSTLLGSYPNSKNFCLSSFCKLSKHFFQV